MKFDPSQTFTRPTAPLIAVAPGTDWASQLFDSDTKVDMFDATKVTSYMSVMAAPVQSGVIRIAKTQASIFADLTNPASWSTPVVVLTARAGKTHARLGGRFNNTTLGKVQLLVTTDETEVDLYESTDGDSFTRFGSSPILDPDGQGRDDGDKVSEAFPFAYGSYQWLYYSLRNGGSILPAVRAARSSDGFHTVAKQGPPHDLLNIAPLFFERHSIFVDDENGSKVWCAFECGNNEVGNNFEIRLASSAAAGEVLTPYGGGTGVILAKSNVPGQFDEKMVATPDFFFHPLTRVMHMFFCGAYQFDAPRYGENEWSWAVGTWPALAAPTVGWRPV